jgi:hypothetical protein
VYVWDPLKTVTNKAKLERGFNTIYVYSDVIKYQIVGDIQAPLIGTVPVQGKRGEQVYWSFSPAYYIPINKTAISTIELRLCNETGDLVPFDEGSDVLCKMHFRRRRGGW